jgi:hypothetical protein
MLTNALKFTRFYLKITDQKKNSSNLPNDILKSQIVLKNDFRITRQNFKITNYVDECL